MAEEQKKDKGAMVISLDEIPDQDEEDRLTQLSAKLGRYTRSLRRKESEFAKRGRLHPRATTQMLISAIYKRDTLRLLLERGEVNTFVLFDTYREMKGRVVLKEFGDACGAIHNYVKTGGEEVVNGGLPLK
ncbi:hypothetical protein HQ584_07290 [Patescibacteria group bacterium]|nr:hypothetical protein [Patescibacteria group bacterium]